MTGRCEHRMPRSSTDVPPLLGKLGYGIILRERDGSVSEGTRRTAFSYEHAAGAELTMPVGSGRADNRGLHFVLVWRIYVDFGIRKVSLYTARNGQLRPFVWKLGTALLITFIDTIFFCPLIVPCIMLCFRVLFSSS